MEIYVTVPIIVNGIIISEFDAAVEVNVVSYGCPAQTYGLPENCFPAEGPEWEVEATYVEVQEKNEEDKLVSNLIKCPDELLIFVTRYIEGEKFMDKVCDKIAEDDMPDYYEPGYND